MKYLGLIGVICATGFLLTGCASTNFTPYEGDSIREGTGGTKKVVDGIDIWTNGTPLRKYQLLGLIDDFRGDIIGAHSGIFHALAEKAKAANADAVIIADSKIEFAGTWSPGTSSTTSLNGTASSYGDSTYYQGQAFTQAGPSSTYAANNLSTKAWAVKYLP